MARDEAFLSSHKLEPVVKLPSQVQHAHLRKQFFGIYGFFDIVAGVELAVLPGRLVLPRGEDDVRIGVLPRNGANEAFRVGVVQGEIDEHGGRVVLPHHAQRLGRVAGPLCFVSRFPQDTHRVPLAVRFAIHDEYRTTFHSGTPWKTTQGDRS